MAIMSDWSQLQSDILRLIKRRLHSADDYVRFGVVCKPWRSVYLERDHACSLLPCLMLDENEEAGTCEFYCLFSKKLYELHLPEIVGRERWGSPYGWLSTLDEEYHLHLVNPISNVQILLPPLDKCSNIENSICDAKEFQESFVSKVLLSSSPLSRNCVVCAICGDDEEQNMIAFARVGDETWTPLQCSPNFADDVVYFDEKFYVVDYPDHVIIICDSNGIHLKTVALPKTLDGDEHDYFAAYIVELSGQIHVILRIIDHDYSSFTSTWTFKVLRLDIHTEKLEEVKNLGNWSFFLGENYSFSISTSDHPECNSNCIYFSDKNHHPGAIPRPWDTGIYRLDTGETQPLLEEEVLDRVSDQPVWIKPVLG